MNRREFLTLAISALGASAFKLKAKGNQGSVIFTSANPGEALKRLKRELGNFKLVPADEETRRILSIAGEAGSGKRALVFARKLETPVETSVTFVNNGNIKDPRRKYSGFYSYLRRERKGQYLITIVFEGPSRGTSRAVVEINGRRAAEIDLRKDGKYSFKGHSGPMVLEVKDGRIAAIESSCEKKICVKTGFISSPHEKIVCIPNRIVVSIEGSNLDGVSF